MSMGLPDRHNKKQVLVYLDPELYAASEEYVLENHLTKQEFVGLALNRRLSEIGSSVVLQTRHERLLRRSSSKAARQPVTKTPSRRGRIVMGGWFHASMVDQAIGDLSEHDTSLQSAIETGIASLLGEAAGHTGHLLQGAPSPGTTQEIPEPDDELLGLLD